jgi:hypothetical protein
MPVININPNDNAEHILQVLQKGSMFFAVNDSSLSPESIAFFLYSET